MPLGVWNNQLKAIYRQQQAALWTALIQNNHYTKRLFDGNNVKLKKEMAQFMGAWATLRRIRALRGKSPGETVHLVLETNKHRFGLCVSDRGSRLYKGRVTGWCDHLLTICRHSSLPVDVQPGPK